ncbi:hypothetical protein TPA0909_14570 [Streptomyces albus]|nr:hypothetical protein TPA0909_14570 [Streptomyces albus]
MAQRGTAGSVARDGSACPCARCSQAATVVGRAAISFAYDALTSDALSPRESAHLIATQMETLS